MPTNSRSLTWKSENQPVSITSGGVTETYTYDADNARIKKERASKGITTYYIGEGGGGGRTYEEEVTTGQA